MKKKRSKPIKFEKYLFNWETLVVIAVALGAFLRFYKIEEYLVFHGELGHNYLAIKNIISQRELPLLGPPTSHPWLSFGPLFYWIMAPILSFANFDPISGGYLFALLGSLMIIVNYEVIFSLFNKRVAAISSYLLAISPLLLIFSRESRFYFLTTIFFYPFIWFFIKALELKKENKSKVKQSYMFWAVIFLGIMLNFHLTTLVLMPGITAIYWFKKKNIQMKYLLSGFVGVLIPTLPFILNGFKDRFAMLLKLIAWVPYRLAGFIGIYPKNTVSFNLIWKNVISLNNFFIESFVFQKSSILSLITFIVLIVILYKIVRFIKAPNNKDFNLAAFSVIFILSVVAIFLHGEPPKHYYVVILPLPIIFLSIFLSKLANSKSGMKILLIILAVLTILNMKSLFSKKWFFRQNTIWSGEGAVPYPLQLKISKHIIKDADGKKFKLRRVGEFDYFAEDYSQNYKYLLWWLGNEPVTKADLTYIIYEKLETVPNYYGKQDKIFFINNIAILRKFNNTLLIQ